MRFASPEVLWLLLALPVFLGAGVLLAVRRRRMLLSFAGGETGLSRMIRPISRHARVLKVMLLLAALMFGVLAVARPQLGGRMEAVTRSGIDVMLVIDTSLSMACEDVAPNRYDRAKFSAESLINKIPGDRIGLVTFAGVGILNCPLTLDHGAVGLFMDATDPHTTLVPGTALADALQVAVQALTAKSQDQDEQVSDRGKVIVLFTDGEDHEEGMDEVLGRMDDLGIRLYAIGVGTTKGGPIPVEGADGGISGYKKDGQGRIVTTRLDEAVLAQLAGRAGGQYWRATGAESEIDRIVEELSGLEGGELGTVMRVRYEERFQVPLLLAVLALLAEMLIPDRRKTRNGEKFPGMESTSR
jgi:Ca-activated chloride channel family protein